MTNLELVVCYRIPIMAILLAISVTMLRPAHAANDYTAEELYRDCNGASEQYCMGFLMGVLWGEPSAAVCVPEPFPPAGQLRVMYLEWAGKRLDTLDLSAGDAADEVFLFGFPCR
jgi:hypothetical protein